MTGLGQNPDPLFRLNKSEHMLAHRDASSHVTANEDNMSTPLAYTIGEVCAIARMGRTSLYEAIANGELTARKRGRRTIILADDLRRWLDSLPTIIPKPNP